MYFFVSVRVVRLVIRFERGKRGVESGVITIRAVDEERLVVGVVRNASSVRSAGDLSKTYFVTLITSFGVLGRRRIVHSVVGIDIVTVVRSIVVIVVRRVAVVVAEQSNFRTVVRSVRRVEFFFGKRNDLEIFEDRFAYGEVGISGRFCRGTESNLERVLQIFFPVGSVGGEINSVSHVLAVGGETVESAVFLAVIHNLYGRVLGITLGVHVCDEGNHYSFIIGGFVLVRVDVLFKIEIRRGVGIRRTVFSSGFGEVDSENAVFGLAHVVIIVIVFVVEVEVVEFARSAAEHVARFRRFREVRFNDDGSVGVFLSRVYR